MSALSGLSRHRAGYYYREAVKLARLGRHDRALAALNRVITLAPDYPEAHYLRGLQLSQLGRPAEALADFDHVAACLPGETDVGYQRGFQLFRLGRHAQALAAVEEFLRLAPGNPDGLMLKGAELEALDRPEEALDAFGEVLTRDPGNAVAHHNRAMTLTKLGRSADALAAHEQAAACAPGQAFFRIQKGIALVAAGGLDRAMTEFDAACRLQPAAAGEAEAWAGAILWHRGDAPGARRRFARVQGRMTGTGYVRAAALMAVARCALDDPGGAEQAWRAAAGPSRGPVRAPELAPLYDLLGDPPLPGLDRLSTFLSERTWVILPRKRHEHGGVRVCATGRAGAEARFPAPPDVPLTILSATTRAGG